VRLVPMVMTKEEKIPCNHVGAAKTQKVSYKFHPRRAIGCSKSRSYVWAAFATMWLRSLSSQSSWQAWRTAVACCCCRAAAAAAAAVVAVSGVSVVPIVHQSDTSDMHTFERCHHVRARIAPSHQHGYRRKRGMCVCL
jgi:hypothetical protein